jgi:hypothetical protein
MSDDGRPSPPRWDADAQPAGAAPLRVGLLLDAVVVPAWTHRVVESVAQSRHATVALAVFGEPAARPSRLDRTRLLLGSLLYELYARLDRRFLRPATDPFRRVDLEPLLAGVPRLVVRPRRTRFSDYFDDEAVAAIRDHRLDVLLRFGFRILRGDVLGAARFGVWSYHHDDPQRVRGGPPGFWEVMEQHPTSGSVLQVLGERLDAGRVLYRSWAPTHRRSVIRNRAHVYWKSAGFARRVLERVAADGELPRALPDEREDFEPYSHRLYRKPGNLEALPLLGRFAARSVAGWAMDRLTRPQWFLAYRFGAESVAAPAAVEPFRFTELLPPRDRFWADPFPWRHDGRWFVFLEEYEYRWKRGVVSVVELYPERGAGRPTAVLEADVHLSHPFLLPWKGELFLIPETAQARQVRAYRCVRFPDQWTLESVLLDGIAAADATLHQEGDRWWLFANVPEPGAGHAHDELHLFHADSPMGPWQPHRRNPVVSDARSARPAGSLFRRHGLCCGRPRTARSATATRSSSGAFSASTRASTARSRPAGSIRRGGAGCSGPTPGTRWTS